MRQRRKPHVHDPYNTDPPHYTESEILKRPVSLVYYEEEEIGEGDINMTHAFTPLRQTADVPVGVEVKWYSLLPECMRGGCCVSRKLCMRIIIYFCAWLVPVVLILGIAFAAVGNGCPKHAKYFEDEDLCRYPNGTIEYHVTVGPDVYLFVSFFLLAVTLATLIIGAFDRGCCYYICECPPS